MHSIRFFISLIIITSVYGFATNLSAQAEVMAWGNINGIRIDGQLMEFRATLCTPNHDWSNIRHTAKESHYTYYERKGDMQIITPQLDSLFFTQTVENTGKGKVQITIETESKTDTSLAGVFFCFELPGLYYANSRIELDNADSSGTLAQGFRIESEERRLEVSFEKAAHIKIDTGQTNKKVYIALISGNPEKGQKTTNSFTLKADGTIDREPVQLALNADEPGRKFIGLGGNFRLQNPEVDPEVIDYNLNNLRVAMGRVEMPWHLWHQNEEEDPIAQAEAGNLHPGVEAAMEMAQRLYKMDMPVLIADWWAPKWAIIGERRWGPGPDGLRGNQLKPGKMGQIYESIGDYIYYMKKHYGVEIAMFSFNESDLGIDVRQTAIEHREFIKGLGKHLAERGLMTKLLLGDTADANGYEFTYPAIADSAAHKYIGAVSFHSWRGWETETLQKWRDISTRMNIPLIVGEGSTDAAAWRYNDIFDEPTFAMHEINLYTRILDICQPKSILQWQLTSDYSLLAGGGVFGNDEEPLHPMQRFWNLKQLASTPEGAFHMEVKSNSEMVSSTGFGNIADNEYAVHIVNNGATREATLTGIPESVKELRIYVTDEEKEMKEGKPVPVKNGTAEFTLDSWGFTSLITPK